MAHIDAHVHVWTDDVEKYPLADGFARAEMQPPTFFPEDILAHARPCGVERVVLVQMSYYGFDNSYMLDVMNTYAGIFSGVAVIDMQAERPDEEMHRLATLGVRGFRVQPRGDVEYWLDGPGYERAFRCGADERLAICPLINPDALPALARMCERFPATPVIVDHLCRIGASSPIREEDVDALCALARHPQVMVKASAFYALGAKREPYRDLVPIIERVYRSFGADRLMWASDCPYQVQGAYTYAASIGLIEEHMNFLSNADRAQILGGTAERFFF